EPAFVVNSACGRIVDVNPAACDALATPREQLIGRPWSRTAGHFREKTVADVDGRWFVAVARRPDISPIRNTGVPCDFLTGLSTRESLLARVASDSNDQLSARLAVLFIDLDGFKQVNDTYGHTIGDQVLQAIAARLIASVR